MKNEKQKYLAIGIICIVISFVLIFVFQQPKHLNIKTKEIKVNIKQENKDELIDWTKLKEKDIALTKTIELTEPGIYNLYGNLKNGYIKINTIGDIKLILNDVTINNQEGPAIYIENANATVIEIPQDKEANLIDGKKYNDDLKYYPATIYSETDLIIDGEGTLNVNANFEDGIVSKKDLKIKNGNYNITSLDDAIRGKNSISILNGTFNIDALGDSIKSNLGTLYIENGLFNLENGKDGIQAEKDILIKNGNFTINSKIEKSLEETTKKPSIKGIKSNGNILIENAIMDIKTKDDSIHSEKIIGLRNGIYKIISNEDGMKSNDKIIIDNANIDILNSKRSIKSNNIIINNGLINLASIDEPISVNKLLSINGGITSLIQTKEKIKATQKSISINKGTLIITSEDKIPIYLKHSQEENLLLIDLPKTLSEEDILTITNDEEIIIKYKSNKLYDNILVVTDKLELNKKYQIKVNDQIIKNFKLTSTTTKLEN